MDVLMLGTGDAFTRTRFGTSALIRTDNALVLIDCPDPIHRVLHEATRAAGWNDVTALNITDILLTHLHGDHSNGLESLGFYRRFARREGLAETGPPRLYTSEPAAARLWEKLAPAMDAPGAAGEPSTLADFYELHTLAPDAETDVAGLTVTCRFTHHPIPTIGLLISDGNHTLGWSSDTPFEQAHINWLDAADVIIHESNLGRAHTPLETLESVPPQTRRKFRLVHTPDDFDKTSTSIPVLEAGDVISF